MSSKISPISSDLRLFYLYKPTVAYQIGFHNSLVSEFSYEDPIRSEPKIVWYYDNNREEIIISDDGLEHEDFEPIVDSRICDGKITIKDEVRARAPEDKYPGLNDSNENCDDNEDLLLIPDENEELDSPIVRVIASVVARQKIISDF